MSKDLDKELGIEPISDQENLDQELGITSEGKDAMVAYMSTPNMSEADSALQGFGQGASFEFADEMGSGLGALLEKGANLFDQGKALVKGEEVPESKKLSDLYNEYLKFNRARNKKSEHDNPNIHMLGQLTGGAMLPGAMFGPLSKPTALQGLPGVITKAAKGAGIGTISGAANAAGASEDPVMSGEFASDVYHGAKVGAAIGGGLPLSLSALKGGAQLTGDIAAPITKGFRQGLKGINLAGEEAERRIQANIIEYGEETAATLVSKLNNLGKLKTTLIKDAKSRGVKIDETALDKMILDALDNNPKSSLDEVASEMANYRELLTRAKQGPEILTTKRVFYGDKPTKLAQEQDKIAARKQVAQENKVEPQVPTDRQDFEELLAQKQIEQQIPGSDPTPLSAAYHPIPNSNKVLGVIEQQQAGQPETVIYKKVASKLVDQDDAAAIEKMEELLAHKQAEQRALPGSDDSVLELILEPTEIPTKSLAIIRQRQVTPAETPGSKRVASKVINTQPKAPDQPWDDVLQPMNDDPSKVLSYRRQAIVDKDGNITGYRNTTPKIIPREEAAKFTDVTEKVRAGGKDLQDPEEAYQLYKDLRQKAKYGDKSFQTDEAKAATGKTISELKDMLRQAVPGLKQADEGIGSLRDSSKLLGIGETRDVEFEKIIEDLSDGSLPQIKQNEALLAIQKKISNLINMQEAKGSAGGQARKQLDMAVGALRKNFPELADDIQKQVSDLGEQAIASKSIANITDPDKFSTPRRFLVLGGNAAGYGVHKGREAITHIGNMAPEQLKMLSQKILLKGGKAAEELSRVLGQLPDKSQRARNAVLFGIMQNPAYRQMILDEPPPEKVK